MAASKEKKLIKPERVWEAHFISGPLKGKTEDITKDLVGPFDGAPPQMLQRDDAQYALSHYLTKGLKDKGGNVVGKYLKRGFYEYMRGSVSSEHNTPDEPVEKIDPSDWFNYLSPSKSAQPHSITMEELHDYAKANYISQSTALKHLGFTADDYVNGELMWVKKAHDPNIYDFTKYQYSKDWKTKPDGESFVFSVNWLPTYIWAKKGHTFEPLATKEEPWCIKGEHGELWSFTEEQAKGYALAAYIEDDLSPSSMGLPWDTLHKVWEAHSNEYYKMKEEAVKKKYEKPSQWLESKPKQKKANKLKKPGAYSDGVNIYLTDPLDALESEE